MFVKLTRAALAFAALVVPATTASAENAGAAVSPNDPAPRVEYRYFGQNAYVILMPSTAAPAPYALTGRQPTENYWNTQNVRWVEIGQGRYMVPQTR